MNSSNNNDEKDSYLEELKAMRETNEHINKLLLDKYGICHQVAEKLFPFDKSFEAAMHEVGGVIEAKPEASGEPEEKPEEPAEGWTKEEHN